MANSLREVKERIEATKSTAQITSAMHMVSQSKVKKAEQTHKKYKNFMKRVSDIVVSILDASEDIEHELLTKHELKRTAYILISSDRGLAGPYNNNLFKYFEKYVDDNHDSKDEYVCASIGKKGHSYLKNNGYKMLKTEKTFVRDDIMFSDIIPISENIIKAYTSGYVDKVVIIYNHYVNSLNIQIKEDILLPIDKIDGEKINISYEFESGIKNTLDLLLPMYFQNVLYEKILDAKISEHSSRMNSMLAATDNALEAVSKLEVLYNRARQEVITNELIDIIGGANAIGGKK